MGSKDERALIALAHLLSLALPPPFEPRHAPGSRLLDDIWDGWQGHIRWLMAGDGAMLVRVLQIGGTNPPVIFIADSWLPKRHGDQLSKAENMTRYVGPTFHSGSSQVPFTNRK